MRTISVVCGTPRRVLPSSERHCMTPHAPDPTAARSSPPSSPVLKVPSFSAMTCSSSSSSHAGISVFHTEGYRSEKTDLEGQEFQFCHVFSQPSGGLERHQLSDPVRRHGFGYGLSRKVSDIEGALNGGIEKSLSGYNAVEVRDHLPIQISLASTYTRFDRKR